MMADAAVVGVSIAGGGLALTVVGLVFRAAFDHQAKPLEQGVTELKNAITNLNTLLEREIETRRTDQDELRGILRELQKITTDHEARLSVVEAASPKVRRRT